MNKDDFWTLIRAVGEVTLEDFQAVGLQAWQWAAFKVDRFAWLARCTEDEAEPVWAAIAARALTRA